MLLLFMVNTATFDLFRQQQVQKRESYLNISIINHRDYHDEIWFSYVYAATQANTLNNIIAFTNVTRNNLIMLKTRIRQQSLYKMTSTWMHKVYPFLPFEWSYESSPHNMDDSRFCMQNLIIFTTCQKDSPAPILLVLKRLDQKCRKYGRIYLILIQLNEANLDLPFDISLIKAYLALHNNTVPNYIQIHFLTLSKHVQKFATNWLQQLDIETKQLLQKLKLIDRVHLWLPIFPVKLSQQNRILTQFIVQGTVTSVRRNYSGLSQMLLKSSEQLKKINLTVLVNSGMDHYKRPLPVNQNLINQSIVQIPANYKLNMPVDYKNYYSAIQSSIGMLPLFGNEFYYKYVASSTIPSSIINRTPLIVDEKLLQAYQILNKQSVWMKFPNEDDVQAMIRISTFKSLQRQLELKQKALA